MGEGITGARPKFEIGQVWSYRGVQNWTVTDIRPNAAGCPGDHTFFPHAHLTDAYGATFTDRALTFDSEPANWTLAKPVDPGEASDRMEEKAKRAAEVGKLFERGRIAIGVDLAAGRDATAISAWMLTPPDNDAIREYQAAMDRIIKDAFGPPRIPEIVPEPWKAFRYQPAMDARPAPHAAPISRQSTATAACIRCLDKPSLVCGHVVKPDGTRVLSSWCTPCWHPSWPSVESDRSMEQNGTPWRPEMGERPWQPRPEDAARSCCHLLGARCPTHHPVKPAPYVPTIDEFDLLPDA